MGEQAHAPNSAAAYMIATSMYNLQTVLHFIWGDVDSAQNDFSSTSAWFTTAFDDVQFKGDDHLAAKEIITGVTTGLAILTSLGGTVGGAVGVGITGLGGIISNLLPGPNPDQRFDNLASLQM
jgi:hypothetical protein